MTKIFKQLARHWAVCLVVFALLFVQAYCDLSLPDYTSKIVDTGIQQGGIESPLPQTLRKSTLDTLSLLMSEEDAQKLQNAYQYYLQDDGVLQLRSDLTEDERTALEDAVTTPDIVLYMAAAQAANTPAGQNSMGMTGLAEMPSAAADTDTETITPTAADLDTVCSQFAAMSQMPGFSRDAVQQQLGAAQQARQLAEQLAAKQADLAAAQPVLEAARAESTRHAGDAAQLDVLAGQVTQAQTALAAYDELDALCHQQQAARDAAQLAAAKAKAKALAKGKALGALHQHRAQHAAVQRGQRHDAQQLGAAGQAAQQPQHQMLCQTHHGNAGNIHQRAQLGAVFQRDDPAAGIPGQRGHQHLRDAQHHAEQRAAGAVVPHQLHHAGHAQCTGKDSVLCKNSQQCIAEKHCRAAYNFLHGSRSTSFW